MCPVIYKLEPNWPPFGGLTFHFMGQIWQNIGYLGSYDMIRPRFVNLGLHSNDYSMGGLQSNSQAYTDLTVRTSNG